MVGGSPCFLSKGQRYEVDYQNRHSTRKHDCNRIEACYFFLREDLASIHEVNYCHADCKGSQVHEGLSHVVNFEKNQGSLLVEEKFLLELYHLLLLLAHVAALFGAKFVNTWHQEVNVLEWKLLNFK